MRRASRAERGHRVVPRGAVLGNNPATGRRALAPQATSPPRASAVHRLTLLVLLALCGFAANSLLCRFALTATSMDPASFTAWRLASGALVLVVLCRPAASGGWRTSGDWRGAIALFAYAIAFSYAYVELHAGVGALLLFGAVQVTMLGGGLWRGERLRALQWLGAALAIAGLVVLKAPLGIVPASGPASVMMLLAGVAWGVYSLLGRGAKAPLAMTAGNFLRAAPLALALLLLVPHPLASPPQGIGLAILSGAVASGIGYALWYAALPRLRASQAALLQLLVPVLTAVAGVVWLAEPVDTRLLLGGVAILGGVALAVAGVRREPHR
jgi:drug/metabolite transporter (DMT)-like permease